jgi:hypothetical protein
VTAAALKRTNEAAFWTASCAVVAGRPMARWALAHDIVSVITTSGGHCQRTGQGGAARGDGAAVGEQFAAVVKHDDAVAQHAPALLGGERRQSGPPGDRAPAIADTAADADTCASLRC